jgi:ABC-2 type transport system ATP-binding protein
VSIVAGLQRPDASHLVVDGVDAVRHPTRAAQRLGLAPQERGIYPSVSVEDNVRFFDGQAGRNRAALTNRVREVADAMQLGSLLGRRLGPRCLL